MRTRAARRPRSARYETTRIEILEAAAKAIAEHGYHGMTMRALARATDQALANLYNYFPSKEELLFALQADAFETLIATMERSLAGVDDPVARLYVFIFNHVRYVAERRSVMRILVHEAAALPPNRRRAVRILKERYFRTARDITASILSNGCTQVDGGDSAEPDEAELERATYSLFGMLNWSYGWYDPKRHGTAADVAGTMHAIALCGLVAHCPHRAVQRSTERRLSAIVSPPLIGSFSRADMTRRRLSR